jgi:hypothetical protein
MPDLPVDLQFCSAHVTGAISDLEPFFVTLFRGVLMLFTVFSGAKVNSCKYMALRNSKPINNIGKIISPAVGRKPWFLKDLYVFKHQRHINNVDINKPRKSVDRTTLSSIGNKSFADEDISIDAVVLTDCCADKDWELNIILFLRCFL